MVFDFLASMRARQRAMRLAGDRFLELAAAEGLADRLAAVTRRFESGLWIGGEVPGDAGAFCTPLAQFVRFRRRQEILAANGKFDLAISLFSLQWINDLPGALVQIRRLLKPDGLFMASPSGRGHIDGIA